MTKIIIAIYWDIQGLSYAAPVYHNFVHICKIKNFLENEEIMVAPGCQKVYYSCKKLSNEFLDVFDMQTQCSFFKI